MSPPQGGFVEASPTGSDRTQRKTDLMNRSEHEESRKCLTAPLCSICLSSVTTVHCLCEIRSHEVHQGPTSPLCNKRSKYSTWYFSKFFVIHLQKHSQSFLCFDITSYWAEIDEGKQNWIDFSSNITKCDKGGGTWILSDCTVSTHNTHPHWSTGTVDARTDGRHNMYTLANNKMLLWCNMIKSNDLMFLGCEVRMKNEPLWGRWADNLFTVDRKCKHVKVTCGQRHCSGLKGK